MKPLSERDENVLFTNISLNVNSAVGMKPLSERDENCPYILRKICLTYLK